MSSRSKRHEGIEIRHQSACPSNGGGRCACSPTYRAKVYDQRSERYIKKTFRSLAEAKAWRSDALAAIRAGTLSGTPVPTLAEAAEAWVAGARSGAIRNRSGDVYKRALSVATSRRCDCASCRPSAACVCRTFAAPIFRPSSTGCLPAAVTRRPSGTR